MKSPAAYLLTLFLCSLLQAEEYRYRLWATTGLEAHVIDKEGKETTITFTDTSAPKARFILSKIVELGISGTKGKELWNGMPYMQNIILRGDLDPKILRTESAPNTAEAEDYQEFTLREILIRFPLVRHRVGKVFDTGYLETHFSFDTLFPDGLVFNGQKIDFASHTIKSEQTTEAD